MRNISEILRLKFEQNLSVRQISSHCNIPVSTVGDYLNRAKKVDLQWPLDPEVSEEILHLKLFQEDPSKLEIPSSTIPLPDWTEIHQELRKKSVTLRLLWEEYKQAHPSGYKYSRFCELYKDWNKSIDPTMRHHHIPGEKLFVDWAGQTIPIQDPLLGEISKAYLFVAVLGASNYTYVEAFETQKISAWISAHVNTFNFLGGVSKILVPDNTKTAVLEYCKYEPKFNSTYQEMAQHYQILILPARPIKPRDKAKVETAVQIAQRRILAKLRNHTFMSLGALNRVIFSLLDELNQQPFQKLLGSRHSLFQSQEKSKLRALPQNPYELATWHSGKVNIDYHVSVDKHFYSVSYNHIGKQVRVRLTQKTIELFLLDIRIAIHPRSYAPGLFTTIEEHRPENHSQNTQWPPSRLIEWAQTIGPATARITEKIIAQYTYPEQAYRSCLGILRMATSVGYPRMEAACQRALHFQTLSYRSVKSILEKGLDRQPIEEPKAITTPDHPNIRGSQYYNEL